MNLSLPMMNGACQIIAQKSTAEGGLAAFGYTKLDFDKLTGEAPWGRDDRDAMHQMIDKAIFGACDALKLPRLEVSAEYVAAAIAYFVHPVNIMMACTIYEGQLARNVDMMSPLYDRKSAQRVTAREMHSLIQAAYSDGPNSHPFRDRFDKGNVNQTNLNRADIVDAIQGEDV